LINFIRKSKKKILNSIFGLIIQAFFMRSFPRIVFFGTPEFAVFSLRRLKECGFPVAGVVTAPDKPSGRGLKVQYSPVKQAALSSGIPLLQPLNLKDPQFLEELARWKPDIQLIIAFRMLPRQVWSLPPLGTINLHASLLPQYRGAAPINWVLMNGEKVTGVTTFFLDDHIDTGKIIDFTKVTIGPGETAGELHDRLMIAGADLVVKTLEEIISGSVRVTSQDTISSNGKLKPAPKLTREDCRIDWNRNVEQIHNQIRGLSPHPGAFTDLQYSGGLLLCKILKSDYEESEVDYKPGHLLTDGKTYLKVTGRNGFIRIIELQPAGRKPLKIQDFLNGSGPIFL